MTFKPYQLNDQRRRCQTPVMLILTVVCGAIHRTRLYRGILSARLLRKHQQTLSQAQTSGHHNGGFRSRNPLLVAQIVEQSRFPNNCRKNKCSPPMSNPAQRRYNMHSHWSFHPRLQRWQEILKPPTPPEVLLPMNAAMLSPARGPTTERHPPHVNACTRVEGAHVACPKWATLEAFPYFVPHFSFPSLT